ncbi:MAG: Uma2 family endonuclease [Candidatus Solibacter sp.]
MSTQSKPFFTPEEYLELERKAEYKSEYLKGEIFAMSGGSRQHDWIATQLGFLIKSHLRGKGCTTHTSDMRVLVKPSGMYTYPDYSITRDQPLYEDDKVDTLTNPSLIVEILSPATELYDRGLKAKLYRDLPSLQELLLISQENYEVELYRRETVDWRIVKAVGLEAFVDLRSIGYTLQLRELYEDLIAHSRGDN